MEKLTDPYLGKLTWDAEYTWFTGTLAISKRRSVDVTISINEDSPPTTIQEASELIRNVIENEAFYKDAIADKYLESYNGAWREGRLWHPRFLFKLRIHLTSMAISDVGSEDEHKMIYFSDGGLFNGHVFELYETKEGLRKVALAG